MRGPRTTVSRHGVDVNAKSVGDLKKLESRVANVQVISNTSMRKLQVDP